MVLICTLVNTPYSVCRTSVINVTRFYQVHNLKEQEITHLNGFYQNFCPNFEQVNGFLLYSCKHTTFCMRDKCYECDKVSPNTQPEGIGNNTVEWLLSGTLVHTWSRRMIFICTHVSKLHSVCRTSVTNVTRFHQIYTT